MKSLSYKINSIISKLNENGTVSDINNIIVIFSENDLRILVEIIKLGSYSLNMYKNIEEKIPDALKFFFDETFLMSSGDSIDFILNEVKQNINEDLVKIFEVGFLKYKNQFGVIEL